MTTIADRISIAQSRINQAAQNCSRSPDEINLLAVSKTKPISDIIAAYQAGQRLFGENYVQEGETKINALQADYPDIEWHFIGPLQSNKTKIVAEHFDWMHTLSRGKIAQRLHEQRPSDKSPLNVCIQVNISQEESKSGINSASFADVATLALTIASLPHLKLRGLMAIPTATDDVQLQQQEFSQLKQLFDQLKQQYPSVDTLSMGMSGDMDIAIANGSTMVRIGSAIFGQR
ncbi:MULTISPECIES: YggS family pyridoxal phosphate-dependent enzyme [Shewanella]|uniref:Pyridoxal phosphate homeostasis protein n=1 Tax=Shewanella psychromarinicola TaxID=2487742 RepID=A0A3N4E7X2_9GAMM|nr:YggS family pyridoxal phosphate-dependent enzyme [Shewanella psychromarinicola]AZG35333.1 YggS family pyridoxal phosphate-dependent enzyme [Shewanella psychromarinicola]MCL1081560.1 YggS family pyridoxal phosphate-dependent enzyme [Shewanella psychromarinicola]RPA32862.1 YggS family pyridoxal phosphate-dependent enzyme [Shewanella psychromarinicola]